MMSDITPGAGIVDLGCGNGRDALFFASRGHFAVGMDLSTHAIAASTRETLLKGIHDNAVFLKGDLASPEDVERASRVARDRMDDGKPVIFYSRFTLHTLDEEQESAFLPALSDCMKPGEQLFLEFRSLGDDKLPKHYPEHYRRYSDPFILQSKLVNGLGFSMEYCMTGTGMAPYEEEDPIVTRMIARKN